MYFVNLVITNKILINARDLNTFCYEIETALDSSYINKCSTYCNTRSQLDLYLRIHFKTKIFICEGLTRGVKEEYLVTACLFKFRQVQ